MTIFAVFGWSQGHPKPPKAPEVFTTYLQCKPAVGERLTHPAVPGAVMLVQMVRHDCGDHHNLRIEVST